ncbi:MAG: glycosyltransferase family 1 protein [Chloroflexota bacterium]
MLIGIDSSRATAAQRTGTEAYSLAIIRALLDLDSPHDWRLYFRDPPAPPPDLFSPTRPYAHTLLRPRRLWTHLGLSAELFRRRPDCLFVPAHVLPLYHPCPSVVTIHDLGYLHFPESHPMGQRLYLDWTTRFSARHATALIADSEATKRDLIARYRVSAEKITVVYPGFDSALKPVRHPSRRSPVAEKYDLPDKFLLHVGTIQPRKNLERLIEAFDPSQISLVLAGQRGWLADSIYEKGKAKGVLFLDYVDDEDLAALYSSAAAYVAPSLYEGFGFTVLEAMACGAPVICSDGGSLPEVAGEAAIIVPAADTQALAEAIRRVTTDEALRRSMIMNGFRNVGRFSWPRAAEQTLRAIESAGRSVNRSA